jgi:hypothetical protein
VKELSDPVPVHRLDATTSDNRELTTTYCHRIATGAQPDHVERARIGRDDAVAVAESNRVVVPVSHRDGVVPAAGRDLVGTVADFAGVVAISRRNGVVAVAADDVAVAVAPVVAVVANAGVETVVVVSTENLEVADQEVKVVVPGAPCLREEPG